VTFIDKSVMTEKEPDIPIFTDFIFGNHANTILEFIYITTYFHQKQN
jgi:hypothetical protein